MSSFNISNISPNRVPSLQALSGSRLAAHPDDKAGELLSMPAQAYITCQSSPHTISRLAENIRNNGLVYKCYIEHFLDLLGQKEISQFDISWKQEISEETIEHSPLILARKVLQIFMHFERIMHIWAREDASLPTMMNPAGSSVLPSLGNIQQEENLDDKYGIQLTLDRFTQISQQLPDLKIKNLKSVVTVKDEDENIIFNVDHLDNIKDILERFKDFLNDPDTQTKDVITILCKAVYNDQVEIVETILKSSKKSLIENSGNPYGSNIPSTLLGFILDKAIIYGNIKTVKALVKHPIFFRLIQNDFYFVLENAVERNNIEILKVLLTFDEKDENVKIERFSRVNIFVQEDLLAAAIRHEDINLINHIKNMLEKSNQSISVEFDFIPPVYNRLIKSLFSAAENPNAVEEMKAVLSSKQIVVSPQILQEISNKAQDSNNDSLVGFMSDTLQINPTDRQTNQNVMETATFTGKFKYYLKVVKDSILALLLCLAKFLNMGFSALEKMLAPIERLNNKIFDKMFTPN